jgi:hypothetical protein
MAETTVLRSSAINRTPNKGAKPQAQLSGALPVVQVNMNSGGPQIQGGQGTARQGVTILPPKGARRNFSTGGLPNQPAKQGVVILPPKEQRASAAQAPLTADQLLLCRHLADKYLVELRSTAEVQVEGEQQVEGSVSDNIKLAEVTIAAIDSAMAEMTAAAAVAVAAAAAPPPPPRAVAAGTRSTQGAASATPRRVARPAPPPVVVRMDAGQPVPVDPIDLPSQADQAENDAQG